MVLVLVLVVVVMVAACRCAIPEQNMGRGCSTIIKKGGIQVCSCKFQISILLVHSLTPNIFSSILINERGKKIYADITIKMRRFHMLFLNSTEIDYCTNAALTLEL